MRFINLLPMILITTFVNSAVLNSGDFVEFKDKKTVEKWNEENFTREKHQLTISEKMALSDYAALEYEDINRYLRQTSGQLIDKREKLSAELTWDEVKEWNEKIEQMDLALHKFQLPHAIYAFRRVDEEQFGQLKHSLWIDKDYKSEKINLNTFHEIKKQFLNQAFVQHNYISTSLIKDGIFEKGWRSILMKIKIPKKTHGLLISKEISPIAAQEVEFLIKRGYTFQYDKFSIIEEDGIPIVKVDVSLINNQNL